MINLRYHIISITAVFLALGIGLTLGSTFLDRVTVDHLESQLGSVSRQVKATRTESDQLRDQVSKDRARNDALSAQLPEQLLAGHLTGVPVLVLATKGTDPALVARSVAALASAGAHVSGTWWLTDLWRLDRSTDVSALSTVLNLASKDVDRLRRNTAIRMADLLSKSAAPPAASTAADPTAPVTSAAPSEPAMVAGLVKAGFIDYAALPGAAEHRVLLPGASTRYVVVSNDPPGTQAGALAIATLLLDELSALPHVPVVAAQGLVGLPPGASGPASEDSERTTFVGPIRQGDLTRAKVTTIDDLDIPGGIAALVLALQDSGKSVVGHFGVATGATRLLPAPVPAP